MPAPTDTPAATTSMAMTATGAATAPGSAALGLAARSTAEITSTSAAAEADRTARTATSKAEAMTPPGGGDDANQLGHARPGPRRVGALDESFCRRRRRPVVRIHIAGP